ncbi:glycoside hydrolase family 43 protein [Kitasatospora aureofaciens]|uniref:glycoside hydrolase family 43 protein n=1 Tax=Kitasatospora aureofaciens TaxID=1894 RepID=UPI0036F45630
MSRLTRTLGALTLACTIPLAGAYAVTPAWAAGCSLDNPIATGADPSLWYANGKYYLVQSDGAASINLRAASTLAGLATAKPKTIWTSPAGTDHSVQTWAPEIEKVAGHWYIYFAAATDKGNFSDSNDTHRMFAITADTDDPMGTWSWGGKVADSTDQWAIDGTVFSYNNSLWMLWSGTPDGNGGRAPQQIYIAHMSDPLHIDQDYRRLIANPDQSWETSVQAIEEGPEAWISPTGQLTIVYNANGSWTGSYSLGALVYNGGDLTTYKSYTKKSLPVFTSANGVYGPGGESLPVPGENGTTWNVYHAKTTNKDGWDDRKIFAQPMTWNTDGTPNFGAPQGPQRYNEATGKACGHRRY